MTSMGYSWAGTRMLLNSVLVEVGEGRFLGEYSTVMSYTVMPIAVIEFARPQQKAR